MSERIKVTLGGESRVLPKNDDTLRMLDEMSANGEDFKVEAYNPAPKKSAAPALQPSNSLSPLLKPTALSDVLGAAKDRGWSAPAPAIPNAPELPGSFRSVGETATDFAVPFANGATLGWGDDAVSAINPEAGQAVRNQLALSHKRSPIASTLGDVAGPAATTSALSALTGGAAAPLIAAGAINGAGNAAPGSKLEGAGWGALTGAGGAIASKALGAGANAIRGATTEQVAQGTQSALGGAVRAGVGATVGKNFGFDGLGALGGLVLPKNPLDSLIGMATKPVAQAIAPAVKSAGPAVLGAASKVAPGAALAAQRDTGNLLGDKVQRALEQNPSALGPYADEIREASGDPARLNATITNLTQQDAEFRKLIPELNKF